jgi:hypothetical protein
MDSYHTLAFFNSWADALVFSALYSGPSLSLTRLGIFIRVARIPGASGERSWNCDPESIGSPFVIIPGCRWRLGIDRILRPACLREDEARGNHLCKHGGWRCGQVGRFRRVIGFPTSLTFPMSHASFRLTVSLFS